MFKKGKKTVSLAYKEKLLAEIAYYEKRIEEALHKRKQTSFEDESSDEDSNSTNPYKLNIPQSGFELKQQEASLGDRASMTLELAMLTIMQSEVNVMVTPPAVRRPVQEDGIWLEVAAECKIDLVSFTITFYAHKPHRRFAPVRYRNVSVELVKPAHQKELAQSVLPKLHRPNLALQVLQSYATAFRSRRTTLLDLAETYADKLRMEAMPEGGYRVKFLNLLQVDWTLENLWSPIVPFCHRMKFEVEYMPKDYIHAIGKLYKQFKDPSLETSERTHVLAKIFDTCLQAQGPAQDLQESLESDPDTAGRLHERRTTIDQEPEVPNVEHSPKKPKGKENKAQNRKTTMAPPKTIPKKAKKVDAKKSNDKENVDDNRKGVKRGIENDESNGAKKLSDVVEGRKSGKSGVENDNNTAKKPKAKDDVVENPKGVKKGIESESTNTAKTRNADEEVERKGTRGMENDGNNTVKKANAKDDVVENRKGVKRGIENEGSNAAKKSKTDEGNVGNTKSKAGLKGGKDGIENGDESAVVGSKNKGQNFFSGIVTSKNTKEIGKVSTATTENDAMKKGDGKNVKSKSASGNRIKGNEEKDSGKIADNPNDKDIKDSKALKKESKKSSAKNNEKDMPNSKPSNTENNVTSKKTNDKIANTKHDAKKITDARSIVVGSKNETKKGEGKSVASKEENTVSDVAISKNKTTKAGEGQDDAYPKDKGTGGKETEIVTKASSKTVVSKEINTKVKYDALSKKIPKDGENEAQLGGAHKVIDKTKDNIARHTATKDSNTAKPKEGVNKKIVNNAISKNNSNEGTKVKPSNFAEKVKAVKEKALGNNEKTSKIPKNKETTQSLAANKKIANSNTAAQKSDHDSKNTFNPKLSQNKNILKENTNQKAVEKNKINILSNVTITKPDPDNLLNVTVTKSKNIPITKQTENKIKMADKFTTRIPMIKSKMKVLTLNDKLMPNNLGRVSKGVATKLPQKTLPVFKKIVNNLPTRISPRKLPSTFNQSSHGFSNKQQ